MIVRSHVGGDGQCGLVLIAQNLQEDVARVGRVGPRLAIKHELNVASHGEYVVITPFLTVDVVKVVDGFAQSVEVEQAGQGHNHGVVAVAQGSSGVGKAQATVGRKDDIAQQIALGEGLNATAQRAATVGYVPPSVVYFPRVVNLRVVKQGPKR